LRARALPLPGLTYVEGPAPEHRPMETGDRRLRLGRVWHHDKAKAARAPGVPIGDDLHALHRAIAVEKAAQVVFRGRIRKIRDINVHAHVLMVDRVSMALALYTACVPPAPRAHSAASSGTYRRDSCPRRSFYVDFLAKYWANALLTMAV